MFMRLVVRYRAEILLFIATLTSAMSTYAIGGQRYANDDQFITYRYAENIAAGHGFVYNIGERVLGATTPLYTLLLAALKFIVPSASVQTLAAALNVLLLAIASIFFLRLARRFMGEWYAIAATTAFAFSLSRVIPEGMESALFILLLLSFLDALLCERHYLASALLSLAILTRPDAGLIAVLVLVYWLQHAGFERTIKLVALCAGVAMPWLVFSTAYFGSFIPQSLMAKLHSKDIYHIPAMQGIKVQLSSISRLYWGRIFDPDNLVLQTVCDLIPAGLFSVVAAWRSLSSKTWIVFAIPLAYLAAFSLSNPIIFPWYVSQMEPLWILATFAGIAWLVARVPSRAVRILLVVLVLAGPAYYWGLSLQRAKPGKEGLAIASAYLRDHMKEGDRIALSNIGIVGYETHAYIFDFIGLVTPPSVAHYPLPAICLDASALYQIPPSLIMQANAGWIVAGEGEMPACFTRTPWFTSRYQKVAPDIWHRVGS